jgi:hypothetical protein
MRTYLQQIDNPSYRIGCRSLSEAISEFYCQWRAADGSIPWVIISDGSIITEADLRT